MTCKELIRLSKELDLPGSRDLEAGTLRTRPGVRQFAALAFLPGKGKPKFLVVTSRRTGRWIFPKGQREKNERGWETAAREAFEEAGVTGTGLPQEIGRYRGLKFRENWVQPLDIALYPVRIDRLIPDWEENGQRQRRMVTAAEAAALLSQPDMVTLCTRFERKLAAKRR